MKYFKVITIISLSSFLSCIRSPIWTTSRTGMLSASTTLTAQLPILLVSPVTLVPSTKSSPPSLPLQDSARLSDDVATVRKLAPLLQSAVRFEASVEPIRPNQIGISIANETEKALEEVLAQFSSIEAALSETGNIHSHFLPPALSQGISRVRKQPKVHPNNPQMVQSSQVHNIVTQHILTVTLVLLSSGKAYPHYAITEF